MAATWDIVGTGNATLDEFLLVDQFPAPDTKQEVVAMDRQGGGLIPTALVTATRLGLRCALVDMLGKDELSRWIEADLRREGVDTSLIHYHPEARPVQAFVIVDRRHQSRTILYTMAGRQQTIPNFLPSEVVRQARLLMIDDINQPNIESVVSAVQVAREAGIPVVADLDKVPPRPDLMRNINHLIVSSAYAARVTGESDPVQAALKLWDDGRDAVIVTCGAAGSWYLVNGRDPVHQPAMPVDTVDTTGCGDVYHGAYAAALLWGYDIEQRVRLATACAALKSMQIGGRRGIPTRAQAEAFLASR